MPIILVGLWLNGIPEEILKEDSDIKELSSLILQGHTAKEIFVAERSLLLSLGISLPANFIESAAQKLRAFLRSRSVAREETDTITISPYTDSRKWEVIKEQIVVGASNRYWNTKAPGDWNVADTLKWLRDKNLGQYCLSFKENDLDGQTLLELNESDLWDLGIRSKEHRENLMRLLDEVRTFQPGEQDGLDEEFQSAQSLEFKSPPITNDLNIERGTQSSPSHSEEDLVWHTVLVEGLSQSFLRRSDIMADIKNSVFSEYSMEKFEASPSGIQIKFKSSLSHSTRAILKNRLMYFLKRRGLEGEVKGELTIEFQKNETIIAPGTALPNKKDSLTTNYWSEFWEKLTTNDDDELLFEDEEDKLNARGAREVLATVRDVKLKEIKKDDPGIKHLKGFSKADLETALSNCKLEVKYEIEGKWPAEKSELEQKSEEISPDYVGMYIECLPQFIIDDTHSINGIQQLVFKDVEVRRIEVVTGVSPPIVKVEFVKWIKPDKVPNIAHNLKTYLKGCKVDENTINNVRLSCLEWEAPKPHGELQKPSEQPHRHLEKKDDFLVPPGQAGETTNTILVKGIPEIWVKKERFLRELQDVFGGVALFDISVTPGVAQTKNATSQNSLQIHFREPLNIQKLPMIALRLKSLLKREQIPPKIVNQVTIQVWNENNEQIAWDFVDPVVGLILKGIPKRIITNPDILFDMKEKVLTEKHTVRYIEPNEEDWTLRILIKTPICSKQEITAIAQRLTRFLARQGVTQSDLRNVLVMSFDQDKWDKLQLPNESTSHLKINPNFIGVEIENVPAVIANSKLRLERIQNVVFAKQKVSHLQIVGTTIKITFGVEADTKAIEEAIRKLKRTLIQMKVQINQINKIIVKPQTGDLGTSSPLRESRIPTKQSWRPNTRVARMGELNEDSDEY